MMIPKTDVNVGQIRKCERLNNWNNFAQRAFISNPSPQQVNFNIYTIMENPS
jgi:hypothetical protein